MEIVAARIDGPTGRQMCGAGKRQTHDPAGRVSAVRGRPASKAKASDARHFVVMSGGGYERLLTIRGIFAKKTRKRLRACVHPASLSGASGHSDFITARSGFGSNQFSDGSNQFSDARAG